MSALTLELPLSPELVLVSPPEEAALARNALAERPVSTASAPASSRVAALAFSTLCAANALAAFAFSLAVAS